MEEIFISGVLCLHRVNDNHQYCYLARYIGDERKRSKGLVTTTPEMNNRSFGTNVLQAILWLFWKEANIKPEEYLELMKELNIKPRVISDLSL